jgi:hypothetical protein
MGKTFYANFENKNLPRRKNASKSDYSFAKKA